MEGAEEVALVVVAPPRQARARALDHHRGAQGLGQEVEVEVAAEVEAVDAHCKRAKYPRSLPPLLVSCSL